ncbi:uncharacterized protein VTP21DRAFT_8822 [Calcarisporiella thermophila]|uniref:uncharacterized protein n=1 Tax=Calcarisporiella thermophila TaxID=911321 RepID=UPI003743388D
MTSSSDLKTLHQKLEEDGYVVIDGLVPPELLQPLRDACERAVTKARNDEWKHRRLVGVQFPPWPEEGPDVWGVQHIMNPELGEPIFAQWYSSEKLIEVVREILGVKEEEIQLELFNLLINPAQTDYQITWHRDAIVPEVSEEEEKEKLKIPHYGCQWNTALYDDPSLIVVPRSHNRIRTPEERRVTLEDPNGPMPGQINVELKAGQTVFYNNNILHRAVYSKDRKRATLHGCMGCVSGGSHRAQNILQHGLAWMRSEEFRNSLPERMHEKLDNLIRLADQHTDVGYSHPRA